MIWLRILPFSKAHCFNIWANKCARMGFAHTHTTHNPIKVEVAGRNSCCLIPCESSHYCMTVFSRRHTTICFLVEACKPTKIPITLKTLIFIHFIHTYVVGAFSSRMLIAFSASFFPRKGQVIMVIKLPLRAQLFLCGG